MQSEEIRKRFLAFFERRGHAIVPSASLIPEGDSSTLFTTAGMQPLVPYLLGQKHPKGSRLVNIQKSLRTGDIDEVGDNTHLTFFEMLGNWSLGDYFKKEAITWSYELLTDKKEGFGLDPKRLYITVFAGNDDAPRDEDSAEIWKSAGVPEHRIYYRGAEDNWWSPGDNGPCGPDSEMFYDVTEDGLGNLSPEEFARADDEQKVVEIWNDVFMEYEKKDGVVVGKLKQKNVDTGAGLERIAAVLQKKKNVFETDLFKQTMMVIKPLADTVQSQRIISDHMRAAVFLVVSNINPSNEDRGYVLRKLLRRSMMHTQNRNINPEDTNKIIDSVIEKYSYFYPDLRENRARIGEEIHHEFFVFRETIQKGLKQFERILKTSPNNISGVDAFILFSSYGFPLELTIELAAEKNITVDVDGFREELRNHQEISRTAAAGKFKGGLGDHSEATVKLHTAHHLLLAALQRVLGESVKQRGSNITSERLRIDFSFDRKLTDEEKRQVEDQVNAWIDQELSIVRREMSREEAEKIGAEMEFGQKYPDTVSVYFIEDKAGSVISKEFCGGPHTENTGNLGRFKIKKEEASSAGVRRIKATLQ